MDRLASGIAFVLVAATHAFWSSHAAAEGLPLLAVQLAAIAVAAILLLIGTVRGHRTILVGGFAMIAVPKLLIGAFPDAFDPGAPTAVRVSDIVLGAGAAFAAWRMRTPGAGPDLLRLPASMIFAAALGIVLYGIRVDMHPMILGGHALAAIGWGLHLLLLFREVRGGEAEPQPSRT